MELLQCTASLPRGSAQWNSCYTLPHRLGAVGSGPPAIHYLTARGQRAADLLQCTAPLPGGSGQWTSCNALPHRLGAVGSGNPAMHCHTSWGQWAVDLLQCTAPLPGGSGQCNSCNSLPHCLGQWAVQFLQCTASLHGGSGQCNSCNTLPHCLGAVGGGPTAIHRLTAWGQWAVDLLQYTASLPGGSGQWTSFNALLHCLGAVGSGPPATHCLTAWGQWAVDLLQCTAPLPGGIGQWTSCNALPHCLGAVGSATSAMHCLTALGQWAVEPLQCTASLPWGQWAVQGVMGGGVGLGGWWSLSRVGSGDGISLGGRGRGDSRWCVSPGASISIRWWGLPWVASVAWSQGGVRGGGGVGVALLVVGARGWVLRWLGVWASLWDVWVLCVRAVRSLLSLAGCGAEVLVGGGYMGVRVGLWSLGNGWLPVDGARWYGVWVAGLLVGSGCSH